ncbi:hypothetical protein EsDP_00003003 [Epichloe bromicola]|uniref:Uncharacterized protein n=1 Tax=Epichloe bromicola TaxID=79588 RepID=A0ABQ0CMG2_9HYPO
MRHQIQAATAAYFFLSFQTVEAGPLKWAARDIARRAAANVTENAPSMTETLADDDDDDDDEHEGRIDGGSRPNHHEQQLYSNWNGSSVVNYWTGKQQVDNAYLECFNNLWHDFTHYLIVYQAAIRRDWWYNEAHSDKDIPILRKYHSQSGADYK